MDLRLLAAVVACACGSGKVAPKDAATQPQPNVVDAGSGTGSGSGSGSAAKPTTGDIRARVEWVNVPVVARASPGNTPCETPRAASVMPTTTWGVPDAVVVIDGPPTGEARVVLAGCALTPRVALGAGLVIASAMDRSAKLVLAKRGQVAALDAIRPTEGTTRTVMLPIAGHEVTTPLEAGAVYELATTPSRSEGEVGDRATAELAWIVAANGAITDASGVAVIRGLPPGRHAITAWLPPRAGQPGRVARATVEVTVGSITDTTLDLAGPPK